MPHVIVQATPNVTIKEPDSLLKKLNSTLWETGHFGSPQAIKARFVKLETFLVGVEDEQQAEGFVYIQLRLMPGRSQQIRDDLAEKLHACLKQELVEQQSERVSVQYCVEVVELTAAYKKQKI
ncbi:5-carboxymethyl-2-hydroxymuconate Delta-isomerase [Psychrobacter phenylpyruvicus]|uniref:5-carboxymethyl-2-hydroxymuconate delta-isomerase n=1 Tax=Psychrobacter phenylpyruvicus TaxID=29432 RepID=A0A379LMY4_9GAMM|nr:5-carboxymethyl-2-hydroxymuconate Delta-isomerase [Psychrobacter phenylpyruvicus]SUD91966.1 5-carboxymethyl-2-hydroxymuconate delta-isomerase [Psychrobacter phenylpyruvicus]